MKLIECRIAIVGLGLMGGSLALALKGKCAGVDGVDIDSTVIGFALTNQVVDHAASDPIQILPKADLVILGAPVSQILSLLRALPELHPGNPVVLDLGSTKREIVRAMAELPSRFDPIGGHPMCGKEKTGLANAAPDLFMDAPFALTPLQRTTSTARDLAEQVALTIGARPIWLKAETHDLWTASTSHLPYVLACALANAVPGEALPMVGPGLRSTIRVAGTSTRIMMDILQTNQENILGALGSFREELDHLEALVRGNEWDLLKEVLDQAADRQKKLSGGLLRC